MFAARMPLPKRQEVSVMTRESKSPNRSECGAMSASCPAEPHHNLLLHGTVDHRKIRVFKGICFLNSALDCLLPRRTWRIASKKPCRRSHVCSFLPDENFPYIQHMAGETACRDVYWEIECLLAAAA